MTRNEALAVPYGRRTVKTNFIDYALIFSIFMLLCGYGISSIIGGKLNLATLGGVFLVVLLRARSYGINVNLLAVTIGFLVICSVGMLVAGDGGDQLLMIVLYSVGTAILLMSYGRDYFVMLTKLMYFLAICSLILWLAFLIVPGVVSLLPTLKNANGIKAYTMLFSTIYAPGNMTIARNQGIFWEPGAYQTFLNLALAISLFFKEFEHKRNKYLLVFAITLVTTFSTTGYVVCGTIIIAYLINRFASTRDMKQLFKTLALLLFIAAVFYLIYSSLPDSAKHQLFGKLEDYFEDNESTGGSSARTRFEAVKIAWDAFCESPLFGVGANGMAERGESIKGMTVCTPINWFSYYGVFLGLLCNIGLYKATMLFSKRKLTRLLIFIGFILAISTESYWRNPCVLVIVFAGWAIASKYRSYNESSTN